MNLRNSLNIAEALSGLRGSISRAQLSVVEIVFLAGAILFALLVAFFYFNSVQPLASQLERLKQQEVDLQARLRKITNDEKRLLDQTANAEKILESLSRFDAYLKPDERGMTQIINEIDQLGKTHNIVVGDASYRVEEADEPVDENGNPKPQSANREKKPKIYPNLGIDTMVIGDYANLRQFLANLERSKQFLVINSLTFQGGDEKLTRQLAKGGKQIQLSAPEAVPVSLKIELDTFFQSPFSTKDGQ